MHSKNSAGRPANSNPWTRPLETFRLPSSPEAKARAAFRRELYAERTSADVFGVSAEAMQLAVVLAMNPTETQFVIDRLGFERALAVTTYARACNLDPVQLAGIANPKQ